MTAPQLSDFLVKSAAKGYEVFLAPEGGCQSALNIVGWRNKVGSPDKFDDYISVYWQAGFGYQRGTWIERTWHATTRPGIPWLITPMNPKGAAILVPGQYKDAYAIGNYHGYQVLRQVGELAVYRDNNRDSRFDENSGTIEQGIFGIHIHKAGLLSKLVGVSSAGCQVFQRSADFSEFIEICKRASEHQGNKFTYTLMEF